MTASVYVPLWIPGLAFCLLCLMPDAFGLARGVLRSIAARRRHRRLLERLWRDEVGGGRATAPEYVATTRGAPRLAAVDNLPRGAA